MRALSTLAALWLLSFAPVVRAETLAEAAAREAARRQQTPAKKAPVYTEGELNRPAGGGTYNPMTGPAEKASPRPSGTAPSGLVLPIARAGAGDESTERRGGRTEAEWRETAAALRAHILGLTEEVAALEKNPGGMAERKLVCPDGNPQCWNPKATSSSPGGKLVYARRALQVAQQALADLEDEARRNSVPPGWLR